MTLSGWLVVFLVACGWAAGYIAALAWPPADAGVTDPVAVFCLLAVALLTLVVIRMRQGRP